MHEEVCDVLTSSFQIRSHMIRYSFKAVCTIMTRESSCKLNVCGSYSICQVKMKRLRLVSCSILIYIPSIKAPVAEIACKADINAL